MCSPFAVPLVWAGASKSHLSSLWGAERKGGSLAVPHDNVGAVSDLRGAGGRLGGEATANLRTKILDFGGFDSSIISISRGGNLMSTGNFPESLSQASNLSREVLSREIGHTCPTSLEGGTREGGSDLRLTRKPLSSDPKINF